MADPATLAFYQEQAPRYTMSFDQAPSRHLDRFLDRLESGAHASSSWVAAGGGIPHGFASGASISTPPMAPRPWSRRPMSGSTSARGPCGSTSSTRKQLTTRSGPTPVCSMSGVPNCPRSSSAIHRALRPGGWHYASYKLGTGEGRDRHGRLHNFPAEDWLETVYRDARFAIADTQVYPGKGADGVMRDWMALTVRRP
jgi:hypothetical protein